MKRRLIIMRHAKSSWKHPKLRDHQRPLKGRGRREARRAGQALSELGWAPDQVLSSDSTRTRKTWLAMVPVLPQPSRVTWSRDLYHGGPDELCPMLAALTEPAQTVLVLGHNPGWEDVIEYLTGSALTLKTARAALVEAEGDWPSLVASRRRWTLTHFLDPRELLRRERRS